MDISGGHVWNAVERSSDYFLCALEKLETNMAFCDLLSIFFTKKYWEKEWGAVTFGFLSGKYLIFWKVLIFLTKKKKKIPLYVHFHQY